MYSLLLITTACRFASPENANWELGPFTKPAVNPVLQPIAQSKFFCPVRQDTVYWEEKDVFNPSAVVRDGKIFLLYRAEDKVGKHAGTSRLGLAISDDGAVFKRFPEPVFFPDHDFMNVYEWEGGVEDPRLVEDENGRYILTYTAYDGKTARLCVATSTDLMHWTKHGLAFGDGEYRDLWSKSGSIVTRQQGEKFIAEKISNHYVMYWGDTHLFLAYSEDLIHWTPLTDAEGNIIPVLSPREGMFDSDLVEPGPQGILRDDGIWLLYNSRNIVSKGDNTLPDGNYAAGQALFDRNNPERLLKRSSGYSLTPDQPFEITGQVNNVCFAEALVWFNQRWMVYYGTADSKIAVATAGH